MMRKTFFLFSPLPVIMLAGCTPVDQAALVYASKVQLGIQAGSGTVEQPGAELSLGYKQHDVAFVPVMAGRHCPKEAECTAADFPMKAILGRNTVTDQSRDSDLDIASAKSDLDSAKIAYDQASAELAQADIKASTAKAALVELKRVAMSPPPEAMDAGEADAPVDDEAADNGGKGEEESKIATAEQGLESQLAALASLRSARDAAQSRLESAANRYATLQQIDRRLEDGDEKRDALSVYGRFNGTSDTGIEKPQSGMKVELGKIFSTGIAAQNLTQGMSRASCLEAGLALISATKGGDDTALAAQRTAIAGSIATYCIDIARKD